jgi:hypothetical protein
MNVNKRECRGAQSRAARDARTSGLAVQTKATKTRRTMKIDEEIQQDPIFLHRNAVFLIILDSSDGH